MKAMKMMTAAALLLSLALSLCACGGEAAAPAETTAAAPVETTATPAPETTEAVVDDGNETYTVTIQDEAGNPIAGAMVQLCQDTCYPGVANDQGVATFQVPAAEYKVSFLSLPAGYTYSGDAQEFYFESGSTALTIVLKAEA